MKALLTILLLCVFSLLYAQPIPSIRITELTSLASRPSDSVWVINFWATYCAPCVNEMPYLEQITERYKNRNVGLIFVSLDFPETYPKALRRFVAKKKIRSEVVWLNETDADYFCNAVDKRWGGSIPATWIVHTSSGYRRFYEDSFTAETFEAALKQALGL